MRQIRIHLVLIAIVASISSSLAQTTSWQWLSPRPQGNSLNAVQIIDSNLIVAVGEGGTFIRSIDGGMTWSTLTSIGGTSDNLRALSFVSQSHGTIVGEKSILQTYNGGLSWNRLPSIGNPNDYNYGVSFTDEMNGFIVGATSDTNNLGGLILHTTDGGTSWERRVMNSVGRLWQIQCINESTAVAVGLPGAVLRTTNRGQSWMTQSTGESVDLFGLAFTDVNHGVVVGTEVITRTTNGGASWIRTPFSFPRSVDFQSVSFADAKHGIAVGSLGNIYATSDQGITWGVQPIESQYDLRGVSYLGGRGGVIVGGTGIILQPVTGKVSWLDERYFANVLFHDIFFSTPTNGVAVGEYFGLGRYFRTTNGGFNWTAATIANASLQGVFFPNALQGTVVGLNGTISQTTNGGVSWIPVVSGTSHNLLGVAYFNDSIGVAVGDSGFIFRTTDSGNSWAQESSGTNFRLRAVAVADDHHALAIGQKQDFPSSSLILRSSDAGLSWEQVHFDSNGVFLDVSYPDSNHAFVVGGNGLIKYTTDGGTSWAGQASGSVFTLTGVSFKDRNNGSVVGELGTVLHTTNGGLFWETKTTHLDRYLNAVAQIDSLQGIAVGDAMIVASSTNLPEWSDPFTNTRVELFDMSFGSATSGMVVGGWGTILHSTDGGGSWLRQRGSSNESLNSVSFRDANNVVAVGSWGSIFRSSDAGTSWQVQPSSSLINFQKVRFNSSTRGTMVGYETYGSGYFSTTSDGGATWQRDPSVTAELFGVKFLDSLLGIVVGGAGAMYKTTNGGVSWTHQQTGLTDYIRDAAFNDKDTIVIVTTEGAFGGSGFIYRTTNGGTTWAKVLEVPNVELRNITFINALYGYAAGWEYGVIGPLRQGKIYSTSDGGLTWMENSHPVKQYAFDFLEKVQQNNGGVLFLGGENGIILCSAFSPLRPKIWTGVIDSSWHNAGNWDPPGIPIVSDSVVIPASGTNPVIFVPSQRIVISALTIRGGGRLTINSGLRELVVKSHVRIHGTLKIQPSATPNIVVGGNWIVQPGGGFRKSSLAADEGFVPSASTVSFTGAGIFSNNFFNVIFDTASAMQSDNNIWVQNQCTLLRRVVLRSTDTLFILNDEPQAILGEGTIVRGTIQRTVRPGSKQTYRFESAGSSIQMDTAETYPTTIAMTTYPDTIPSDFGGQWVLVASSVDTLNNIITADSVNEFSRWSFGRPRPTGIFPEVNRVYSIKQIDGIILESRISLRYEQSEIGVGVREDSLRLLRLVDATGVKAEKDRNLPMEYLLEQNFPNPFNPITNIRYQLPFDSRVSLKIYDLLGRELKILIDDEQNAGFKVIEWNASNFASGIYFYRLKARPMHDAQAGEFNQTRKLSLVK